MAIGIKVSIPNNYIAWLGRVKPGFMDPLKASNISSPVINGIALMWNYAQDILEVLFNNINALSATSSDEPDMEMAAISGRSISPKAG